MLDEAQTTTDVERELELERECWEMGRKALRDATREAQEGGYEMGTPYGSPLVKAVIEPLVDALKEYRRKCKAGRATCQAIAYMHIKDVSDWTLAYLTARVVIDRITQRPPLMQLARSLGRLLEAEMRMETLCKEHPYLGRFIEGHVAKRPSLDYRTNAANSYARWRFPAGDYVAWSLNEAVQVGTMLIDQLAQATGLVEIITLKRNRRTEKTVVPTEATSEWIAKRNAFAELLCPVRLPMLCQPAPWDGLKGGGYLLQMESEDASVDLPLVKARHSAHQDLLAQADLSVVCAAVNKLQETPWKVNRKVLEVAQALIERGGDYPVFAASVAVEAPPIPADIKENADARKLYRIAKRDWVLESNRAMSRRVQRGKVIWVAEKLLEERFFFPYQLDFRGRAYTIPYWLSPQGPDLSKALLLFGEAKPIDTPEAAKWLSVHGANCWGFDKVSFEDRVEWVGDNWPNIKAVAEDPLSNLWWMEADDPWQFLAWCFEVHAFEACEGTFYSSLPVFMDGSCNGIQHFSAMARDEVGGALVNLLPSDIPQDIYQTVADRTIEKLDGMDDPRALQWLAFGIDRKLTKRPVMVLPYGGTNFACREYVYEATTERIGKGAESPWEPAELRAACNWLADIVWASIGEVVIGARTIMDWLQFIAATMTENEKSISWVAPSGLPIYQSYRQPGKAKAIKTKIAGKLARLIIRGPNAKLNVRKQVNAIAPNFVHSMDAAALFFSVSSASLLGINCFATVHDSFGVLAADAEEMAMCLREAFVGMYQQPVLDLFRAGCQSQLPEGVELPPVPCPGKLDLNAVLKSPFFFS